MSGNGIGLTRAAIYTRLSVERPDQELSSVTVQRERCEQYAASQGWLVVPTRYNDDGFSGGTANRPALQRLLRDVEAGEIDAVVTVRIDRLSRSMLDFLRIMELLDRHGAALVSITQEINTGTAWGKMALSILAGFAQFERDLISERTRDKVAAARRKGRWTGGMVPAGFDLRDGHLVPNPAEALRVEQLFRLFLDCGSLAETVREANYRGWRTKAWTTQAGTTRGGTEWTKTRLHGTLSNVVYVGQVRYKGEVHAGTHDGIIDPALFEQVQRLLQSNGHRRSISTRSRGSQGWLSGILWCRHCDARMIHSTTRKRQRVYRYYTCGRAMREGWKNCPSPSVAAHDVESAVLAEVQSRITGAPWDSLTLTKRHALATRLLDRVVYDGTEIEITFAQREADHA